MKGIDRNLLIGFHIERKYQKLKTPEETERAAEFSFQFGEF